MHQLSAGSLTTTRFTRTRHSDIVHPVSSSQLTETRDRVRSLGGYNNLHNAAQCHRDRLWLSSLNIETLQPDMRPERWTALNVCLIVQTDG